MSIRIPQDVLLTSDKEHMNWLRELAKALNTVKSGSFTWDPPNVGGGATVSTTLTSATIAALAGMTSGMPVHVTPPSTITAGLVVQAWVPANDSLTISLTNVTGGAIDEPSATWAFLGRAL